MPTPRAPKLGSPSPQERKRTEQLVRRSQAWTAEPPLRLTQGASGFHVQLDTSIFPFLGRLTAVYTLTLADVAATGAYPGMQAGTNLYAFMEQGFDQATGLPFDETTGRQTALDPLTSNPQSSFALEDHNALLTVPGEAPAGYAKPGPYVELRLKGVVHSAPVYQFNSLSEGAWVAVNSVGPGTIYTGREFTDAVLNGTTTLGSPAQAQFSSADVGKTVVGHGIAGRTVYDASFAAGSAVLACNSASFSALDVGQPVLGGPVPAGTTIGSVTSASTASMTALATATQSNVQVNIGNATTIVSVTNATTAIMIQAALTSLTNGTVLLTTSNCPGYSGTIVAPVSTALCSWSSGASVWFTEVNKRTPNTETYQCRLLGTDAHGTMIWATRFEGPSTCSTNLIFGPFVTGQSCASDGSTSVLYQYLCIPNGDICDAHFVSDPSGCSGASPPPPPLSPPPSPPPVGVYGDIFFFGNDW